MERVENRLARIGGHRHHGGQGSEHHEVYGVVRADGWRVAIRFGD
jgi:hypothetical protein